MELGGNTQRMETAAPSVRSTGRLSSQEREDGQDPSVLALVIREIELGEHGRDVRFDGLDRQVHLMADRCVGQPLRHEGEDGPFPIGESVERVALTPAGDEPCDELGMSATLRRSAPKELRSETRSLRRYPTPPSKSDPDEPEPAGSPRPWRTVAGKPLSEGLPVVRLAGARCGSCWSRSTKCPA